MNTKREMTPEELIRTVEEGHDIQVLDVRAPHRLASGYIDVLPEERFINLPGSEVLETDDMTMIGLARDIPVAVVCGHGNDSATIASWLSDRGYAARSVRGGMVAWMNALVPRTLPPPDGVDQLIQFDRVGKGALGYLLVSRGEALVIDPPRDFHLLLERAAQAGARIAGVADTHVHADYLSGAPAMTRQLGIPYYLHPADNVYPYDGTPGKLEIEPLADGSAITLGRCTLGVDHTPGHTEGSVTYRLNDQAAFTGDFVFVRSIGRPDLGGKAEAWARELWRSLERARGSWARGTMIYPAHYASDAERQRDHSVGAAFGEILDTNEPLQIRGGDEFVSWILDRQTSFPEAYRTIKAVNVRIVDVTEEEAEVLEAGRNECAMG